MLNAKYVRDNLDAIRASMQKRHLDFPLDRLLKLDEEWRALKKATEELQARRNKASIQIAGLKEQKDEAGAKKITGEMSNVKKSIDENEKKLAEYEKEINDLVWNMPNTIHDSVKYGKDETENVEVKRWGDTGKKIPVGHTEILEKLGLIDIERAAKVSGARFYYLKGDLVLLAQSLERFALDELVKKGYTPVATPYLLRREHYKGVTGLGDFEDALYLAASPKEAKKEEGMEDEELFLIATSEHPMAAMHAGEVFSAKQLPVRYVGISPCFRREAGAHGKDTKGIFRVHQFEKVEQFIFSRQEDSWKCYEELIDNEEYLMQKLNLPYHRIEMCTGDIGIVAAKKTDLEIWFPSQQKYRELTSASNCTDWQSLRLEIKYDEGKERKYVHTLNATAVAVQRTLAAIVENYYNDNGTITVPDALVPYMGKRVIGR
ncbi:MAG: serine--tRNA ligase [Candidatus Micrarchaeota archaeon]|nr:serine--tRNA ligase [Candidatus Micrarchaeota archaeon]